MANLKNEIIAGPVDVDEFVDCALGYFGAGGFVDEKTAFFGRKQGEAALIMTCTKAGKVVTVEAGPHFDRADVKALRNKVIDELLNNEGTRVITGLLLSSKATTGYFRYRDAFQIIPSSGPQAPWEGAENPSVLEVSYLFSKNYRLSSVRQFRKLLEVELCLLPLLPPIYYLQSSLPQHGWVHDYGAPGHTDYRGVGYAHPMAMLEGFSDTTQLKNMTVVGHHRFYRDQANLGTEFVVPDTLERDLDKIAHLSDDDRVKFFQASYWLKMAGSNASPANSQAYVALVSAVEALIGKPKTLGRCDACERSITEGNAALFNDFIDRNYLSGVVSEKRKKEFYSLRSDLAHGYVLRRDIRPWGTSIRGTDEEGQFYRLHDLVRELVYGWLVQA